MKSIAQRNPKFVLLAHIFFFAASPMAAQSPGQRSQPTPTPRPNPTIIMADQNPRDDESPMTTFEEELRAKRAIKLAEKEHEENLTRAREISQIAKELRDAAKHRTVFGREDIKRLDRLEKLTKKVRGEAGGEDDEVKIDRRPVDVPSAISRIGEAADSLSKSVQNTPRQVVSATVIDTANVLLELIKLARTFIQ